MAKEKEEQGEKKRQVAIPGEAIVEGPEYLPGDGTRREDENIIANRHGLVDIKDNLVKVIPLAGGYIPRAGNLIICRVEDVTYNGWLMDIKSPANAFLSMSECPTYIKGDLTEYYDIGDMMACKVTSVKQGGVDLTIKGRNLGKLEEGLIMHINPHKVPRVIGKSGSMIKLIKQETGCKITVVQNGAVWINGDSVEDEVLAKDAILFVTKQSFISGLTEMVEEFFEERKSSSNDSKSNKSESGEQSEDEE
jgi:exosome complex component RRP4